MRALDLDSIVRVTDGKKFSEMAVEFSGVATDTRKEMKGQLFVALKGEQFDAHDFCAQAVKQGAAGVLIHRLPPELQELRNQVTVIVVKDTLKALQQIAHFARHQSKASFVAITGSNGKTTSKEFSAAVVGARRKVHFSKGSFNNHWGVPFSILSEPPGTEVCILEMGMNHAGEIKLLGEIADPDIVVCSTVGHAHIEHFGHVDGIAAAKEEIYTSAPARARRIYNLDNPWTMKMFIRARAQFPMADRLLSFSQLNPKADIFLQIEEMTMEHLKIRGRILGKEGAATVPIFGAHNLTNLMVATSVAAAVGLTPEEIWPALALCKTNWGRNQLLKTKKGGQILFDGYNANPDSMKALLDNVPMLKATAKIGVFGEMLELGEFSAEAHLELGEKAGRSGLDVIWFYGAHSSDFEAGARSAGFNKKLFITKSFDEHTASQVAAYLTADAIAVVKGSRGMKLERFVVGCDPIAFDLQKS